MAFKNKRIANQSVVTYVALLGCGTAEQPDAQYFQDRTQWDLLTKEVSTNSSRSDWQSWANNLSTFLFDRWSQTGSGFGHIQFRLIVQNGKIVSIERAPRPYNDENGVEHGRSVDDMDGDETFKNSATDLVRYVDNSELLRFPTNSRVEKLQVYISLDKPRPWAHRAVVH